VKVEDLVHNLLAAAVMKTWAPSAANRGATVAPGDDRDFALQLFFRCP
jgi:hypothetical protein